MVGILNWYRYFATRLQCSVSYSAKICLEDKIRDTEFPQTAWRYLCHGRMTFLYWSKDKMAKFTWGDGETLLVRKLPVASLKRVRIGDTVLLKDPVKSGSYLVRRIAALEGHEMLSSDENDESFFLEKDQCWVLVKSKRPRLKDPYDSRSFGPVNMDNILGRVIYAYGNARDHRSILNSISNVRIDLAVEDVELDLDEMEKHMVKHRSAETKLAST